MQQQRLLVNSKYVVKHTQSSFARDKARAVPTSASEAFERSGRPAGRIHARGPVRLAGRQPDGSPGGNPLAPRAARSCRLRRVAGDGTALAYYISI
jgi:hypothetical protein